jgi:hypothetical protein
MSIEIRVKCHKCGDLSNFNVEPINTNKICEYTFTCSNCGALNTLFFDFDDPNPLTHEWLCLPPEGFEWILPSGKITPIVGEPIYVSAFGEYLSWKRYIEKYKLDPEIAYQKMRYGSVRSSLNSMTTNPNKNLASQNQLSIKDIKTIEILCNNCQSICKLDI